MICSEIPKPRLLQEQIGTTERRESRGQKARSDTPEHGADKDRGREEEIMALICNGRRKHKIEEGCEENCADGSAVTEQG